MTHLRGGLQLIELLSSKTAETYLLKKFFVLYFVAHDIMGRTASEDPSLAESGGCGWLEDDDMEEVCFHRDMLHCSKGPATKPFICHPDRHVDGLLARIDDLD
jgi:anaphase-promoting complex subunit 1